MLPRLLIAVLCLLCSGCFRITYHTAQPGGETYKNRYWNTYFVAGLIPVQEAYDFDSFCPGARMSELRSYQSPANVLATILGVATAASTVEGVCSRELEPAKTAAPAPGRRFAF